MAQRRVLLVEDEGIIAMAVAFGLEMAGDAVRIAANGHQAVAMLEAERPDIIITDVMMPVMDGGELIRWVRAHPELRDIPIIVASAIPEAIVRTKISGYTAYLSKPIHEDRLLALMERLLSG